MESLFAWESELELELELEREIEREGEMKMKSGNMTAAFAVSTLLFAGHAASAEDSFYTTAAAPYKGHVGGGRNLNTPYQCINCMPIYPAEKRGGGGQRRYNTCLYTGIVLFPLHSPAGRGSPSKRFFGMIRTDGNQ